MPRYAALAAGRSFDFVAVMHENVVATVLGPKIIRIFEFVDITAVAILAEPVDEGASKANCPAPVIAASVEARERLAAQSYQSLVCVRA